jgi:hypothetical protein
MDPEFREKICGFRDPVPYDTSSHKKPDNPIILEKFGGVRLAENEKEELLIELFPNVAQPYLKNKKEREIYNAMDEIRRQKAQEAEERRAKYLAMSPEERQNRLMKGLENYNWASVESNPDLKEK